MRFAKLREVVEDPKATGERFAERAAAAGYGFGYRENYPSEYRATLKFLKKALLNIDLSVEAKTWSSRMALQL